MLSVVAQIMRTQTVVENDPFKFSRNVLLAPSAVVLMEALAGVAPSFKASRMAVAEHLEPLSELKLIIHHEIA